MLLGDAPVVGILPATDLERARGFWKALGVREVWHDDQMQEALFEAGRGTLFDVYERADPTRAEHTVLGFDVPDLDVAMSDMRERGVRFEDYDLPHLKTVNGVAEMGDARAAWFRDTEGNIIMVGEGTRMTQSAYAGASAPGAHIE